LAQVDLLHIYPTMKKQLVSTMSMYTAIVCISVLHVTSSHVEGDLASNRSSMTKLAHFVQHRQRTRIMCCCKADGCWEAWEDPDDDFVKDSNLSKGERGHKTMDGDTVGYGSGEKLDDWGQEFGKNGEHKSRVGDTCYWKDSKENGSGKSGDCSATFHPHKDQNASKNETETTNTSKGLLVAQGHNIRKASALKMRASASGSDAKFLIR